MAQDPNKGRNGLDSEFDKITRARPVSTPTRKRPDPITGRSESDAFYALGGEAKSIDARISRAQKRNANPSR